MMLIEGGMPTFLLYIDDRLDNGIVISAFPTADFDVEITRGCGAPLFREKNVKCCQIISTF